MRYKEQKAQKKTLITSKPKKLQKDHQGKQRQHRARGRSSTQLLSHDPGTQEQGRAEQARARGERRPPQGKCTHGPRAQGRPHQGRAGCRFRDTPTRTAGHRPKSHPRQELVGLPWGRSKTALQRPVWWFRRRGSVVCPAPQNGDRVCRSRGERLWTFTQPQATKHGTAHQGDGTRTGMPSPERREDTPQDPDPGVHVPRVQEAHPVAAQSTPAAALGRGRQRERAPRQSPPLGNW